MHLFNQKKMSNFFFCQINKEIRQTNIQIGFQNKIRTNLTNFLTKISEKYKKFADLCSFIKSNKLSLHWVTDHAINLKSRICFNNGLFYEIFKNKLFVLKNYFEKNLKSFFYQSRLVFSIFFNFIHKKSKKYYVFA